MVEQLLFLACCTNARRPPLAGPSQETFALDSEFHPPHPIKSLLMEGKPLLMKMEEPRERSDRLSVCAAQQSRPPHWNSSRDLWLLVSGVTSGPGSDGRLFHCPQSGLICH